MEIMKICGKEYPVIGEVESEELGQTVPLVDIRMMTDYRWQQLCLQGRLENPELYRKIGEDVEAVIADLRLWLEENKEEAV